MTNKTTEADNKEKAAINYLIAFFVFCMLIVIGSYIYNFRNNSVSNSPSDWGALGDYFGGVVNPLISLITLFFLIKTYLSQKEELRQSGMAADAQREISQKTAYTQLLSTRISASYELIAIYRSEMEGTTQAMNTPGGGRSYTGVDGIKYFSNNEQIAYRTSMAEKIQKELKNIDRILEDINTLSKAE